MSGTNPLAAAIAAGLTFPIQAKLVGANGKTAEMLFESTEESHVVSLQLPIEFPCEWTLTGANQRTENFTQTSTDIDELFDRVRKRAN